MYGWIWRRLPFGLSGKLIGSTVLLAVAVAVLWFWVFPAAEPLLPFDDVQVGTGDVGGDQNTDSVTTDPSSRRSPSATPGKIRGTVPTSTVPPSTVPPSTVPTSTVPTSRK